MSRPPTSLVLVAMVVPSLAGAVVSYAASRAASAATDDGTVPTIVGLGAGLVASYLTMRRVLS